MSSTVSAWIFTKRKLVLISFIVLIVLAIYYIKAIAKVDDVMNCFVMYKEKDRQLIQTDLKTLDVLFKAKHKPQYNGRSIFFLETHIKMNSTISLSTRQACSVEAAGELKRKLHG